MLLTVRFALWEGSVTFPYLSNLIVAKTSSERCYGAKKDSVSVLITLDAKRTS